MMRLWLAISAIALAGLTIAACGNPVSKRDASATAGRLVSSSAEETGAAAASPSATTTAPAEETPLPTEAPASGDPATGTPPPCMGHCPTSLETPSATTTPGPVSGIPRVPALRALPFSPGETLLASDLALRGAGSPGRGEFTGSRLVIGKIQVDARFETATVGSDGQMPNPSAPSIVAWYDFATWPDLGGMPLAGGNVVLGGDLRQGATEGVFVRLGELAPGDLVQLFLSDGRRLFYRVEFNKTAKVAAIDMTEVVRSTADESVTLITAAGTPLFSGQGGPMTFSDRRIVWGRRLNCELNEAPETPTMNPYLTCEEPR